MAIHLEIIYHVGYFRNSTSGHRNAVDDRHGFCHPGCECTAIQCSQVAFCWLRIFSQTKRDDIYIRSKEWGWETAIRVYQIQEEGLARLHGYAGDVGPLASCDFAEDIRREFAVELNEAEPEREE